MGDAGPRMEVCPYCKKSFKRLKSHLPHCKMIGPPVSADEKSYESKPATLSRAKKEKRPTKDLTKFKGKEFQSTKSEDWPERTAAVFPLPTGALERVGTAMAEGEITGHSQLSSLALKHTKPQASLQRGTTPQSPASDATCPKRELARDVCESRGRPSHPLEAEASLLAGSVEPFLSNQDRKYSSVHPHAKPASSAHLKSDTADPQRQKLLAKLLHVPISDCHAPKNGSHGVGGVGASVLSRESGFQGGGHLSGASPNPGNIEMQKKSESFLVGLHTGQLSKPRVRGHQELALGIELCQRKGNTENSIPATEVQERACLGRGGKDPVSASKAKPLAALAPSNVFTLPEGILSKCLSVPESEHQRLSSLAVTSPPEEKTQFHGQSQVSAVTLLVRCERDNLGPTSLRQPHTAQTGHHVASYSDWYPVSQSSLVSHIATADPGVPPRSVGLEWFPELYPGYVGLGVLPRRPQHWNSVAQMPLLATSRGGSVSKVPWLGRSSADSRSPEPLARTPSSFPLTRLLGAVHTGWVRCNTTIKKSGVGGLTMLFAGYFILCCNWSFKHLKLQRWRK